MLDITEPLMLAVGSHAKGSGYGCAMNVISWENGDTEITDYPACSATGLASLVQFVNDALGDRRGRRIVKPNAFGADRFEATVLSSEDAMAVLELGHLTVGTSEFVPGTEAYAKVSKALGMYLDDSIMSTFARMCRHEQERRTEGINIGQAIVNGWPRDYALKLARDIILAAREALGLDAEVAVEPEKVNTALREMACTR